MQKAAAAEKAAADKLAAEKAAADTLAAEALAAVNKKRAAAQVRLGQCRAGPGWLELCLDVCNPSGFDQ